LMSVYKTTRL